MHDVDLIPENDRIDYGCQTSPKHLSVAVNTFDYKLPYGSIFGGVASMLKEHFEKINGCSNLFWKWGGEDDNLSKRLSMNRFSIKRQSVEIARYKMLAHIKSQHEEGELLQKEYQRHGKSLRFVKQDGLNDLQYDVTSREDLQLYTLIKVNLRRDKTKELF